MTDTSEENSLGGRARRYVRVTTSMSGLAARLAGERFLGLKLDRNKHARDLTEALGGLKGPLMKVAQLLATIPEALPKEYADELRQLQADAPPMGWPFVKRRMAAELGPDWQGRFDSFEHKAAAAASLGQVHRAVDHDGRKLACKLQYPQMQSAVEADLRQLNLIFSIYERYDSAISTKQIHAEVSERLREELDYELEARNARMYEEMLGDVDSVYIPQVVPELSTKRLITSTWLEGQKLLTFTGHDIEIRNTLALNMFRAWYVPLYYYGIIHGDPHLGNYSVREDHTINLLDFGCIRIFPPEFVGGVLDLYRALQTDDVDLAVHAYETWGFVGLSRDVIEVLNMWASFIYGPVLEDKTRLLGVAETGVYGRETAEKVHTALRDLGPVEVPREFVFMDRAALGLGSVFIHLQAEINWYRVFNELIEGFSVETLRARQADLLTRHGAPLPIPAHQQQQAAV